MFDLPNDLSRTGVYVIENLIDGKKYIGSASLSFYKRKVDHWRKLRKGKHWNRYLQSAWNKHGESAFQFRVMEYCLPAHAVGVEQVYIDYYQGLNPNQVYNLSPTAGSVKGCRHSPETLLKMSSSLKGKFPSLETRAKISAAKTGKTASPETRAKMSASAKRFVSLKLAREKVLWTPEQRAKISVANRGRKHTPEAKARIATFQRGRKASAETRAKMSASGKNRVITQETRSRLSAARKAYLASQKETLDVKPQ